MNERCERMRDRLPSLATGRLEEGEAGDVRAHLEACAACAGEWAVVRLLGAHEVTVPAQVEARIRNAVLYGRPATPAWRSPGRLAMAATVAFALVTAGLLQRSGPAPDGTAAAPAGEADELTAPVWPAVDEPLMRAGPALYELSVDELETLLKELES